MNYTPDQYIIKDFGFIQINNTLVYSWIVMAILILLTIIINISLKKNKKKGEISKLQNFFEVLVSGIDGQLKQIGTNHDLKRLFPIISTLFIYIAFSNLISLIPGFMSPTASLSTIIALSAIVFLYSIIYAVGKNGLLKYLKKFIAPTPVMLPLNIISEISGIFSMTLRLYGNIMSSGIIGGVVIAIPFLAIGFPVFLSSLGLLSGLIQAYIFSMLAMITIVSSDEE